MTHTSQFLRGYIYVFISVCIYAGWAVASRYGVMGTLSPYDITAIRFTTAGLILLPVIFKKGLKIGPYGYKSGFLLSLLLGACYTNVLVAGMQFAPVSHASTALNGTLLIGTTLLGMHGLKEHISPLRLCGVACSLAGILTILFAKGIHGTGNELIGHALFATGGMMWAIYTICVRAWKVDAIHAVAVVSVFSLLYYMPFYLIFATHHIGMHNANAVAFQAFYQGILTAIVALILYNKGIAILGATRAGLMIPLIPAVATLLAIPVLHEFPNMLEWVGVLGVSIGVFIASGALRLPRR